ncbi:uncharacterized protein LOC118440285 isoform X1 [Vespa mandarinia]|uniref:uncharacterized protein LOC118440285 isoform X1 n=1 Tax=Vespa mandarinia TaxID=7446 RepID=UPI0016190064|nr:uncharacterized protein LOC118440285 isoform X1 [Vespa mandarinia]
MEIKLLRVLIYIKFLCLVSIVAHAEEENSTGFKIQPITTDPLKAALFRIQSNADYLRKLFVRNREDYLEIIRAAIQTEDISDRKLLIIMELIQEIVYSIQECSIEIHNARSNIKNGATSMSNDIINVRKSFATHREDYIEVIKAIQTENKFDRKLLIIKELMEEIVHYIQASSTVIDTARSNINNETFSKSAGIITALFSILENVSLFGDLIFHFPDMVAKIVRLEKKWIDILLLSAQYVDSYEDIVDESSYAVISSAIKELNKIKEKSGKNNNLSNKKKSKRSLSKFMKLEL